MGFPPWLGVDLGFLSRGGLNLRLLSAGTPPSTVYAPEVQNSPDPSSFPPLMTRGVPGVGDGEDPGVIQWGGLLGAGGGIALLGGSTPPLQQL